MHILIRFIKVTSLFSILFIISCSQDKYNKLGFPRVRTDFVEMISDTGAVFKGDVVDIPSDCEIIDHGFVWSQIQGLTGNLDKISLGRCSRTGTFQAAANRAMEEGKTYYFKAFVQTPTTTIYGNELEFVSLGSHAPVISSIYPESGSWGDTITIRGKYFANSNNMVALFKNILATTVYSCDSLMKVTVPEKLDTASSNIAIKFMNVVYPSNVQFHLVPNFKITSIEPTTGTWNTLVKIRGKHLNMAQSVYFDSTSAKARSISDSLITAYVPYNLNSTNTDITLKKFNFNIKSPIKFTFIPGKINSVSPSTGTVGTEILIKINNFPTYQAKVTIAGINTSIISRTDSSITTVLPQFSTSGIYSITISNGGSSIIYKDAIDYKIPEITGVSSGGWGDTIAINGKNLNLFTNWNIYFKDQYQNYETITPLSINENRIYFILSNNHKYSYNKIYLQAGKYIYPEPLDFIIPDPVIDEVIGPTDYQHPYVTIKGKYFNPGGTLVTLIESGDALIGPGTETNTKISLQMPPTFKGTYSIKVSILDAENYGGKFTIRTNCIKWDMPISLYANFLDFNMYNYHSTYIIEGLNTSKSYIKYLSSGNNIGEYEYDHYAKSIIPINNMFPYITFPAIFKLGQKLYLTTGRDNNYTYFNSFFECDPVSKSYTKLPDFPGEARTDAKGFSFNNKGYLVGGHNSNKAFNELWQYDPVSKEWTLIADLPIDLNKKTEAYVLGNYVYLFNSFNIWKFDPSNNNLENIYNAPVNVKQYGTEQPFFSQNNKIYFQLGYYYNECWEFDLTSQKWTFLFNFPFEYQSIQYSYILNNKAYLAINTWSSQPNNLAIIEFDPTYLIP